MQSSAGLETLHSKERVYAVCVGLIRIEFWVERMSCKVCGVEGLLYTTSYSI